MATHENLPAIRWVSKEIEGKVGKVYLVIGCAVIPAMLGLLCMFPFGAQGGAALWMAVQISILGTALATYLTDIRIDLACYEQGIDDRQGELAYSALIKRLYNNPVEEYLVIGWGTFLARLWVILTISVAGMLAGLPLILAVLVVAITHVLPNFLSAGILVMAAITAWLLPAASPYVLGVAIIAAGNAIGTFERTRSDPEGRRKFANGSTFYVAHEIMGGPLTDLLRQGGGYERARDAIKLATREQEMRDAAQNDGWRPTVGDLHKGQQLNTSDLAATLRNQDEE